MILCPGLPRIRGAEPPPFRRAATAAAHSARRQKDCINPPGQGQTQRRRPANSGASRDTGHPQWTGHDALTLPHPNRLSVKTTKRKASVSTDKPSPPDPRFSLILGILRFHFRKRLLIDTEKPLRIIVKKRQESCPIRLCNICPTGSQQILPALVNISAPHCALRRTTGRPRPHRRVFRSHGMREPTCAAGGATRIVWQRERRATFTERRRGYAFRGVG